MNRILKDIVYLSEDLKHRESATQQEALAADYIETRIQPFVDVVQKSTFNVVKNAKLLMSAYYGEFIFICALAFRWPAVALYYGAIVFFAYMAEHMGFPVFSRLFAGAQSTNITGIKKDRRAQKLLIFTAYMDTSHNFIAKWFRHTFVHIFKGIIPAFMILVLAVLFVDVYGDYADGMDTISLWIKIVTLVFFVFIALITSAASLAGKRSPGANNNASGVAALLEIAERLHKDPIPNTTVLYFFSGDHFGTMADMRKLSQEINSLKKNTCIINLEGVGAGDLHYTEAEGILFRVPCSNRLVKAASEISEKFKVRKARVHRFMTNAYLPLLRGIPGISLVGLDKNHFPRNYGTPDDIPLHLDAGTVSQAVNFAETLGRKVTSMKEEGGESLSIGSSPE